jgi:hypothetical protein
MTGIGYWRFPMDFSFPKEYQLFRQMVREFAENEMRPLT